MQRKMIAQRSSIRFMLDKQMGHGKTSIRWAARQRLLSRLMNVNLSITFLECGVNSGCEKTLLKNLLKMSDSMAITAVYFDKRDQKTKYQANMKRIEGDSPPITRYAIWWNLDQGQLTKTCSSSGHTTSLRVLSHPHKEIWYFVKLFSVKGTHG